MVGNTIRYSPKHALYSHPDACHTSLDTETSSPASETMATCYGACMHGVRRKSKPASTRHMRMVRRRMPHMRSACAFCGGAYGTENKRLMANSSQNVSRSCDMNSPPLSVCHVTGLSVGRYDLFSVINLSKAARTSSDALLRRKYGYVQVVSMRVYNIQHVSVPIDTFRERAT